jgi:CheY-like chemotaxis protein
MKNILVVDDDLSVLSLMARALEGYNVTVARHGLEAVALATTLPNLDLLITDYLMPAMAGDELAGRLRTTHPSLKTLLVTAHGAFVDAEICGTDGFLKKPFRCADLRDAVTRVLG